MIIALILGLLASLINPFILALIVGWLDKREYHTGGKVWAALNNKKVVFTSKLRIDN